MCASERLVLQPYRVRIVDPGPDATTCPLLICVLGTFRVLQAGQPVPVHGSKTEALLCHLALHYADGVPGAALLDTLWPVSDTPNRPRPWWRAPVFVCPVHEHNSVAWLAVIAAPCKGRELAPHGSATCSVRHNAASPRRHTGPEGSGGVWSDRVWNRTRRAEHDYPQ